MDDPNLAEYPAVLAWAEVAATENLKARYVTADKLAGEAASTLTLLLAGVGGSLAYAAKLFEMPAGQPVAVGAAWLCGYLALLCVALVTRCLMIRGVPAVYNSPDNLAQPGWSLAKLRKVELRNMQERIDEYADHNSTTARWLNGVRLAACFSPLVFVLTALRVM